MKAMILAAGLGTRLRPLTLEIAKPAIPVLGKPLVVRLVENLLGVGVTAFRLNLHHLPHTIERMFASPPYVELPVSFSYEPNILGTAGGLKANESFFDTDVFLMANGDIIADFPLHEAIAFHRSRKPAATMILYPQSPPYRHTPIRIDQDFRIRDFKGRASGGDLQPETYVFTGIHVLDPGIFSFIPAGVFHEINDQVYPLLMDAGHEILGFPVNGYWNDLGDPARYLEATRDLLRFSGRDRYVSGEAEVRTGADAGGGAVIEAACVLEEGARVRDSILWKRVTVKEGVHVSNCIVAADTVVTHNCAGKIITRNGAEAIGRVFGSPQSSGIM
ncbi:MAG: NDP-sugar synthase [Thermodesulfobacteriota bacterium]